MRHPIELISGIYLLLCAGEFMRVGSATLQMAKVNPAIVPPGAFYITAAVACALIVKCIWYAAPPA